MDEALVRLLADLHKSAERQGPGGEAETRLALRLAGLDGSRPLEVADVGCGTEASTILLAKDLDARITAVYFLPEFLEELKRRAMDRGVEERITPLCCSMDALPFPGEAFDVIWFEGAERPPEIQSYWEAEYPEIDVASAKIGILERRGCSPAGYFVLPPRCWLENYYHPLRSRFGAFLDRHAGSGPARDIVREEEEEREIALYEKYGDYYSYGVYIARRV